MRHSPPAPEQAMGPELSGARRRGIRVIVADEWPIFREGLKGLLATRDYAVIGEAADACEAFKLAITLQPDVLLLGVAIPRESTFEPLEEVAQAAPGVRTIVLIARSDHNAAIVALQRGARGVLLKESGADVLFDSIECVLQDNYWLHGDDASEMVHVIRRLAARAAAEAKKTRRYGLTHRELEIISGVVAGESNREIAGRLSVREDTVKHHLSKVFDKLGVFSRVELAVFAIHHGLASDEDGGASSRGSAVA